MLKDIIIWTHFHEVIAHKTGFIEEILFSY